MVVFKMLSFVIVFFISTTGVSFAQTYKVGSGKERGPDAAVGMPVSADASVISIYSKVAFSALMLPFAQSGVVKVSNQKMNESTKKCDLVVKASDSTSSAKASADRAQ